jgi:hypothetical protein
MVEAARVEYRTAKLLGFPPYVSRMFHHPKDIQPT